MRKFNLHPLTAAFIGLASSSLYAAETEATHQLSTIVVTASGFEQKITDAPASISVITKEELEKKPYMTLLDAVRDLEGVDIGETRDKTGQGTISMRGMGPTTPSSWWMVNARTIMATFIQTTLAATSSTIFHHWMRLNVLR